jgi:hypothetical protein
LAKRSRPSSRKLARGSRSLTRWFVAFARGNSSTTVGRLRSDPVADFGGDQPCARGATFAITDAAVSVAVAVAVYVSGKVITCLAS